MLHLSEPENFCPDLEAVGGFVEWRKKLLMLKRSPADEYPNVWGFPSGKIRKGEGPYFAMLRELREETGLRVYWITYLGIGYIIYPKITFPYYMYKLVLPPKVPKIILNPNEHVDFRFDTPENIIVASDNMLDVDTCIRHFYLNHK